MDFLTRIATTRRTGPLLALGVLALLAVAPTAAAQTQAPSVASLGQALVEARQDHLWRVVAWSGANLIMGLGLLAGTTMERQPGWRGFGIQATAWGAINLGIVAWAFGSGMDSPAADLASALAAEDAWGNILLVNLGLNVGYVLVGGALAIASGQSRPHGSASDPRGARRRGLGAGLAGCHPSLPGALTVAGGIRGSGPPRDEPG